MKAVILCGGKGTRLMEMTEVLPKPMLPVGGKPLLAHIIDIYRQFGVREFYLPMGYKKEFILAYFLAQHPKSVAFTDGYSHFEFGDCEVTAVDTGEETQTGGRLFRLRQWLRYEPFHFTYGDGLSDVNVLNINLARMPWNVMSVITLVHPEGRFGRATVDSLGLVTSFGEKIETSDWINGGFSVLHPEVFNYIEGDDCNLEKDVYPKLVEQSRLMGYCHEGFWKCVDTRRDLLELEDVYRQRGAIWLKC